MKNLLLIFTLALSAAGVRAALPSPDLVAQIHFAGAQKISAYVRFSAFTNEFCSDEALALRTQTAEKLSVWLAGWLQKNLTTTVAGGAAKLRPLFDDLQSAEWFLESRAAAGGPAEVALVIKLDAARASFWSANLKPFFPAATFKLSGGWLIFDSGTGAEKLGDALAQKVSAPANGWLSVDVNWPRLGQWFPQLKELELPETQLAVTAPDANLHVDGKFFFPEKLSLNLEDWRLPTNALHQPFVSFTAVRGFAAWLKTQPWAQAYQISPAPQQAFVWALPGVPFQSFFALPVPDAAAALNQEYARLQPVFSATNAAEGSLFKFSLLQTNDEITLLGVPMLAPYLRAVKGPSGQYLFGGAFPNTPRSKPLPPELFQRLAIKNLVFYHWEITTERFPGALQLSQLGLLMSQHRQVDGNSTAFKWVAKIAPTLGNTDTEIVQSAPDQFTFTRKAPGGFTAVELLALANWLEAPDFPGCNLKLPPPSERLKKLRQKNSPAPFMPVPK